MIPPEAWWVTAALAVAIAEMKTAVLVNMLIVDWLLLAWKAQIQTDVFSEYLRSFYNENRYK